MLEVTNKCKSCKYWSECNGLICTSLERPPKLVCEDYEKGE